MGGSLEESILPYLLRAKETLSTSTSDMQGNISNFAKPPLIKTQCRGIPRFDVPLEQLTYLLDNGFKVTDIASLLNLSCKTIHRRLQEHGMSLRGTYANLSDRELDDIVKVVLREFPNSGYKSMRGHLAMRRADPEETIVIALQIRVTHRRSYNVRAPLALWHMDGNHKLRRLVWQ